MDARVQATWYLSLDCECPGCGEAVDLLDDPDFWEGRKLEPCEHGTDRSEGVEVVCPKCGYEFQVDLAW